jgi:hypothetical protein
LRIDVVVVAALVSGCSADSSIDTTFDPCSDLTVAVVGGPSAAELESVEEAVLVWDAVLPTQIEVSPEPGPAGTLTIHFDSGDTYYRALYFDAIGAIHVSREHLAEADYPLAIAHELGHAFGLFHVSPDERESLMNVGNLEIPATDADADAVRELWDACALD